LLLKKPNNPLIIIFLTKKYLFYSGATNDVSDFTVDAAEDVADVALDGLKIIDETITGDWGQKNNWPNK
jgi:hypothetical protein